MFNIGRSSKLIISRLSLNNFRKWLYALPFGIGLQAGGWAHLR